MALISQPSSSAYEASSFDAPLMVHTWLLLDCDPLLSPLWITWNVRGLSETTLLCVCVHIWLRFARKFVSWSSFDPLQNLHPSLLGTLLGIGMGIEANMKCNDAKACQFPIASRGSKNFKMGLNMLELQHCQCPPQRPEFERSWHHPAHTLRQLSKLRVCLCDFFLSGADLENHSVVFATFSLIVDDAFVIRHNGCCRLPVKSWWCCDCFRLQLSLM